MADPKPADPIPQDPIFSPEKMLNGDLIACIDWIDLFLGELHVNQSSKTKMSHPSDIDRYDQMEALFRDILARKAGKPPLDLPGSHPRRQNLQTPPALFHVANPYNMELMNLWATMREEMGTCQSSRKATSFED